MQAKTQYNQEFNELLNWIYNHTFSEFDSTDFYELIVEAFKIHPEIKIINAISLNQFWAEGDVTHLHLNSLIDFIWRNYKYPNYFQSLEHLKTDIQEILPDLRFIKIGKKLELLTA